MHKKIFTNLVAMSLSAFGFAATAAQIEDAGIRGSARAGLGYDSNVYQAPRASYIDWAAGGALVNPQTKSGFYIPYEAKADVGKNLGKNNKLLGSASLDGSFYLGGLANANEYNVNLHGGAERVLGREGKSENTIYAGVLLGKHKQVYVDHDTGAGKTAVGGSIDISGRYSYTSIGAEAEYKHRIGKIDYGFNGQYALNDYEDPIVVSQEDHSYFTVGANASLPVADQTRLNLSADHSVRDYSSRHSRNALGALLKTNPLLVYTTDVIGVTLRKRISDPWLLNVDWDHTQRADGYVGYNDYSENRYGVRVLFELDRIKGRLALHHWTRDYPNGYAFDKVGQGAKTYSGNDLKFKAEFAQSKNLGLWAELVYDAQTSTDLRYDYVRNKVMAGASWTY